MTSWPHAVEFKGNILEQTTWHTYAADMLQHEHYSRREFRTGDANLYFSIVRLGFRKTSKDQHLVSNDEVEMIEREGGQPWRPAAGLPPAKKQLSFLEVS